MSMGLWPYMPMVLFGICFTCGWRGSAGTSSDGFRVYHQP